MIKIVTLEWDGKFGEMEVSKSELNKPIRRIGKRNSVTMDVDDLFPHQMAYKIDSKRIAKVMIYVHDAFMRHLKGSDRTRAIEIVVKRRAPWVFTYAERENIPQDHISLGDL